MLFGHLVWKHRVVFDQKNSAKSGYRVGRVRKSSGIRRSWIAAASSSAAVYMPIVAGIIEPMIWPLFYASPILYRLLYWWWSPFEQYLFPQWYYLTSYISDTRWASVVAPFVVAFGLVIFLAGLGQTVGAKAHKSGLVTGGLYGFVRHPQHLGIDILALGLLMLNAYGIRVGDLYAWTLVVFIYMLQADGEEAALEKEFGDGYLEYKRGVSFMIPLLPSFHGRVPSILPKRWSKRFLAFVGIYAVVLTVLTWIVSFVPVFHTR